MKESDLIKITIPKGQIDEPKTPFQHGIYGSSNESKFYILRSIHFLGCDESGDDVFKLRDEELTGQSEYETSFSGGWESSMSEFETDADAAEAVEKEDKMKHEKFKSMRAQHYFMRQSLQKGKELIETDDDDK